MTPCRLLWLAGTPFIALALYAQDERCTLVGSVVDAAGAPAAAADIRLQRSGFGERYVGATDSAGKFEMRGLPAGDYNLIVSLNGLFNKIGELHVGSAKPVDLGVIHLVLAARLPHQFPLGDGRTGLADGFGHLNGSPAQLISPRDGFLQLKSE